MNYMKRSAMLLLALLTPFALLEQPATTTAAIVAVGNVNPDPSTEPWNSHTNAYIGNTAQGSLVVDAGTDLHTKYAYLGCESGSQGQVTVSGVGSLWKNYRYLRIGYGGDGKLSITDGGSVSSSTGEIGCFSGAVGEVTVSGAGSIWETRYGLVVGKWGSATLRIEDGGTVLGGGTIGYGAGTIGEVVVSGAGSTWSSGELCFGRGQGTLTIRDGGLVTVARDMGGAYSWSPFGTVTFGPGGGTLTTGGLYATAKQFTGTGTINTRGLVSDISMTFDTAASLTQTFRWDSEPDQDITVNFDMSDPEKVRFLGVGNEGSAMMTVSGGVTVQSEIGYLGLQPGSVGAAVITGAGSTWTTSRSLSIGHEGTGSLAVTDGGTVSSLRSYVGDRTGSTGLVVVSGAGSTYAMEAELFVGYRILAPEGNGTFTVCNGATASNTHGIIGNGEVTVTGDGSTWTNRGELCVGSGGNGKLTISDGGVVSVAKETVVATNSGSTGKIAFGSGGGTLTTKMLYISPTQVAGTGTINTRGLVSDVDLIFDNIAGLTRTIQFDAEPGQNVTVNLDMSDPSEVSAFGVGYLGSGSLTIQNGTSVQSIHGYLGYHSGSVGTATVTGSGSIWNSGNLDIGSLGKGTLLITDGGAVNSSRGVLGSSSGSTGEVIVSGMGSTWSTTGYLNVGYGGSGTLTITDGATVTNDADTSISGSSSKVTVQGTGSTLTSLNRLYVRDHSGLLVADGGTVNCRGYARIDGASCDVTVRGPGASWTNQGDLFLGYNKAGRLAIIDGGTVTNVQSTLAYGRGSTGEAVVSGAGSTWNNSSCMILGGDVEFVQLILDVDDSNVGSEAVSLSPLTTGGVDILPAYSNVLPIESVSFNPLPTDIFDLTPIDPNVLPSESQPLGIGRLAITNGGTVFASQLEIKQTSLLAIDIDNSSQLIVGSGNGPITNDGTIRIMAGVNSIPGEVRTPIVAGTWEGSGSCQALGGTWSEVVVPEKSVIIREN